MTYHVPVMLNEVLEFVLNSVDGPFLDGTLGGGGHSIAIAEALKAKGDTRKLYGIDQDEEAIAFASKRLEGYPFQAIFGNFRKLDELMLQESDEKKVAAILLDIGVSSHQLDAEHRGFAFKHSEAPIDMRMNPSVGEDARALIERSDVNQLAGIFRQFGEVPGAFYIAKAIKAALEDEEGDGIPHTKALANIIEKAAPKNFRSKKRLVHPATQVFQALRIAVNQELEALEEALAAAPRILMPGGILMVMSYHSLEDRMVKQAFLEGQNGPKRPSRLPPPSDWRASWEVITRKPLVPTEEEVLANPRARSAKLRVAKYVGGA